MSWRDLRARDVAIAIALGLMLAGSIGLVAVKAIATVIETAS